MRAPTQKYMAAVGAARTILRADGKVVTIAVLRTARPVVWKRETVTCEPRGAA